MTETCTLADMLASAKNQPVKNPTQLIINTFLKFLGNTLATILDIHNPVGFGWLMDTIAKYRARIGYEDCIVDPDNIGQMMDNPVAVVMSTIPP